MDAEMKFAVGQLWQTRDGRIAEITDIEEANDQYPVGGEIDGMYRTWNRTGHYYGDGAEQADKRDLVARINEDGTIPATLPEEPPPMPATTAAAGQDNRRSRSALLAEALRLLLRFPDDDNVRCLAKLALNEYDYG